MKLALVAACLVAALPAALLQQQAIPQYDTVRYLIPRNTDDCINPNVTVAANACNGVNMFLNSKYRITGTSTIPMPDGSLKITNKAGFSVQYYATHKIVYNEKAQETYVVYQCGCFNRTRNFPANQVPTGAKVFEGPLQSISADDTSVGEFMSQVAVIDRVMYASELGVNGCYQALTYCGYGAPDPGYNSNAADKITAQVDAYITYGATKNPKSIAMSAVFADTPLVRSEWLKYFATFFNKEFEAEDLYRKIRADYNALMRSAATTAPSPKLVVAWTYKGWNADFVISKAPYKVAYVQDAGGVMVSNELLKAKGFETKDGGKSWSIPQAYPDMWADLLNQVDIIIDETYSFSTGCFVRLDDFVTSHNLTGYSVKAITNMQVYTIAGTSSQPVRVEGDYTGSVGLDWYERGTARCDEVLRDFVRVLNPSNSNILMKDWNRRWLLRLNGNEQQKQVAAVCPTETAKLNDKCQRVVYAFAICPGTVRNCTDGRMMSPKPAMRCEAVQSQKQVIRQLAKQGKTCKVP